MYMLHRLREISLSVRVFEAGGRCRRHLVLEPLPRCAATYRELASTQVVEFFWADPQSGLR
jgi:hypothetical protein